MSVPAPPKPPSVEEPPRLAPLEEPADLDALEALIEEARRRARRRRQRYAGAALLTLLVGLALYVGFARGGSDFARDVAAAPASAQGRLNASGSSLSFRLLSVTTSRRLSGTKLYVRHELRNGVRGQFGRPQNAVVGSDAWLLTPLPPVLRRVRAHVFVSTPGWARVRANVRLPDGTLRLQGRAHAVSYFERTGWRKWSVPVVGGTGRYAKARGTCWVRWRPTIADWNDYRLRLP